MAISLRLSYSKEANYVRMVFNMEYFGLKIVTDNDEERWLSKEANVKEQLQSIESDSSPIIKFGLQYYAIDINSITSEITKYYMYLQLKEDILEQKILCDRDQISQLAVYILQAEMGNIKSPEAATKHLLQYNILPSIYLRAENFPTIVEEIIDAYTNCRGKSQAWAEEQFINIAQRSQGYGYEYFKESRMNGYISVHFQGITIKRDNVPPVFFSWEEVSCFESSANVFTIFSQSRNINASCEMPNCTEAEYVLRRCQSFQKFQMNVKVKKRDRLLSNSFQNSSADDDSNSARAKDKRKSTLTLASTDEMKQREEALRKFKQMKLRDRPIEPIPPRIKDKKPPALPPRDKSAAPPPLPPRRPAGQLPNRAYSASEGTRKDHSAPPKLPPRVNLDRHRHAIENNTSADNDYEEENQFRSRYNSAPPAVVRPPKPLPTSGTDQDYITSPIYQINDPVSSPSMRRYRSKIFVKSASREEQLESLETALETDRVDQEYHDIEMRPDGVVIASRLPENLPRNRFNDVHCYDETRVVLNPRNNMESNDYVNASYVTENSTNKCFTYWPDMAIGSTEYFEPYSVSSKTFHAASAYVIRTFAVENTAIGQSRIIYHIQFVGWPDHGVPDHVDKFLEFYNKMNAIRNRIYQATDQFEPPTLVHCSAGVGRTGVVMLADLMIAYIKNQWELNIPAVLAKMRKQRMYLVQTYQQYEFVYLSLIQYIKRYDTRKSLRKDTFDEDMDMMI
ncbi:Tyrosine-protein phosphatase non-receptor type 21 [Trichoplax sp. H2]|nr:Tyrosine-protein phosphatase non-receptor type 21 [Trichoplax sp. H2]|eukprot:RDD42619.1 Tyrosine-protein phosphatase non-receptor type 21 [Trichoplax sp. H2]